MIEKMFRCVREIYLSRLSIYFRRILHGMRRKRNVINCLEYQNLLSEQCEFKKLLQATPSDYVIDRRSLKSRIYDVKAKIFVESSRNKY